MKSPEHEVREASAQFYGALNQMANGDAGAMADVWHRGADATTMHPVGGREVGWDRVKASFEQVARLASDGRITLTDQVIQVSGDLAYELGIERGTLKLAGQQAGIEQRVTNIYRREGGAWKVVHLHTDLSPAFLAILNTLSVRA